MAYKTSSDHPLGLKGQGQNPAGPVGLIHDPENVQNEDRAVPRLSKNAGGGGASTMESRELAGAQDERVSSSTSESRRATVIRISREDVNKLIKKINCHRSRPRTINTNERSRKSVTAD